MLAALVEASLAPTDIPSPIHNATLPPVAPSKNLMIGYICAAVAVFCFGSNFVPIKKFKTGDGVFFQWILCCAIWIAGFVVLIIRKFPPFQPFAMLGGALWCTGNMMTVPIVQCIGLGLGLLLWGMSNLAMGWLTGTFGLFGLAKNTVVLPWLNYVGFALAILATGCFAFVKPSDAKESDDKSIRYSVNGRGHGSINSGDNEAFLGKDAYSKSQEEDDDDEGGIFSKFPPYIQRIIGISLAVVAGVLYGTNFDPPNWIIQHKPEQPQHGLDYVFSHFTGIWLTSTFYFLVYCAIKKNKPVVFPQIILPAIASGALWSIADICWFVANDNLEFVVSFPIITTGPGLIGALWGVFVFAEIRGVRNYIALCAAAAITITSVICIALSQINL